ncbi:MAG: 4-hydroxy-3-methylbut-2-enyl diphosphate reductase [Deltaproteobacteria bacterium]|jgi:4-hydroxy-3-methylbut-2-enyl diphosphate reductase|nr:4-hydroxy-3-methylbut-2-enyl diphosphate reductase [Deltaproteobacteria bacterium]
MQVIKAKTAGFCMGVSLALRRLDQALRERNETPAGRLYTLGPIIHNPQQVREYEELGAVCLRDHREAKSGDTVIIRAHGLPWEVEQELRQAGVTVLDATCPKVKAAQMAIRRQHESGDWTMLLYGEADHPEVKGLISYSQPGAMIFGDLDELAALPLKPERNYFLAAQTTQDQEIYGKAAAYVREKLGHEAAVLSTICEATRERQAEVLELAGRVRSMVIVGGLNSGNTTRLADIARKSGIFTLHCENGYNMPLEQLRQLQPVGLSAGASTPDGQIDEVEQILIRA